MLEEGFLCLSYIFVADPQTSSKSFQLHDPRAPRRRKPSLDLGELFLNSTYSILDVHQSSQRKLLGNSLLNRAVPIRENSEAQVSGLPTRIVQNEPVFVIQARDFHSQHSTRRTSTMLIPVHHAAKTNRAHSTPRPGKIAQNTRPGERSGLRRNSKDAMSRR